MFTVCELAFSLSQILVCLLFLTFMVSGGSLFPSFSCWAFLWTWSTSFLLSLLFDWAKTTFLAKSGCLLTSWSCLLLSLRGIESLSYPAAVSRQDIVLSCILKSSITWAIFFLISTPKLQLKPEEKWIWQLLKQLGNFLSYSHHNSFKSCSYQNGWTFSCGPGLRWESH